MVPILGYSRAYKETPMRLIHYPMIAALEMLLLSILF